MSQLTCSVVFRNCKASNLPNGEVRLEYQGYPIDIERINELVGRIAEEGSLTKSQRAELFETIETHCTLNALMALKV